MLKKTMFCGKKRGLFGLPSTISARVTSGSTENRSAKVVEGVSVGTFEGIVLGSRLGAELSAARHGSKLGTVLGIKLGTALDERLRRELGARLSLGSAVAVGSELG